MKRNICAILFAAALGYGVLPALEGDEQLPSDFASCASEIDDLEGEADDAHSAAEAAAAAKDSLDDAVRSARSRCTSFGDDDYMCESARRRVISARSDFESAASSFTSAYDDLLAGIRSVQSACGTPTPIAGVPQHKQGSCRSVRNLSNLMRGSLTPELRARFCDGLTESECSTCISR